MRKLKSLLAVAVAATIALPASAITESEQGYTHAHPIGDDLVKNYLENYLGVFKQTIGNESGDTIWAFQSTGSTKPTLDNRAYYSNVKTPLSTEVGDALFIEVNDYWKGPNWPGNNGAPTYAESIYRIYNQIKYGVKSINKVTQIADVVTGKLYHYDATTNRFFFAIRANALFDNAGNGENGSWTGYNTSENPSSYYLNETPTTSQRRVVPFRWYNEYSVREGDISWDNFGPDYDNLKEGLFMDVPHSCANSLVRNHFTTLLKGTPDEGDEPYKVSAFLYVPTGTDPTTINKAHNYPTGSLLRPKVFLYVNKLTAERKSNPAFIEGSTTICKYVADLNWKTSFDLIKDAVSESYFKAWQTGSTGVREESYVYRKIEGEADFTEIAGYNKTHNVDVDVKTYTDNNLPVANQGYYVTYKIVTNAVVYNNVTRQNEIAFSWTNEKTIFIPAVETPIELQIADVYNSKFNPKNYDKDADQPKQGDDRDIEPFTHSTNTITNTVTAKSADLHFANLKAGNTFILKRQDGESAQTDAVKLEITKVETKGQQNPYIAYTYRINNGTAVTTTRQNTWQSEADIFNLILKDFKVTEELATGQNSNVKFQMVCIVGSAEYSSNIVSSRSNSYIDVQANILYRSGTPDPAHNAEKELYTVDVKFKPVNIGNLVCYNIWQNAEKKLVRVNAPASIGDKYEFTKDGVKVGETTLGTDGYVHYRAHVPLTKHVNAGEGASGTPLTNQDIFFTVEVVTSSVATGENTYGNSDKAVIFNGAKDELAVNMDCKFVAGDAAQESVAGKYRAQVSWDLTGKDVYISDAQGVDEAEVAFYTIHRKLHNETSFSPVTKYNKHNPALNAYEQQSRVYDSASQTYIWKGITVMEGEEQIIIPGYVEVEGTLAGDGGIMITPEMISDFMETEGRDFGLISEESETPDKFVLLDFITDKTFQPTEQVKFPAKYYVTAHYAVPNNVLTNGGIRLLDNTYLPDNYIDNNSDMGESGSTITTAIKDIEDAVDSEVVKTVYYNLQGIEVKEPAAGDIVVARYQHANGQFTSKVIRK